MEQNNMDKELKQVIVDMMEHMNNKSLLRIYKLVRYLYLYKVD